MRKMPYRILAAALLIAALASSCGYNPKRSGGSPSSDLGFAGTAECLLSGCHDALEAAAGSYPGFTPDTSWALAGHANINASPDSTTGIATGCDSCHDPVSDFSDAPYLFTSSSGAITGTVLSAVGLTARPFTGCEGCHGSGTEHYAYSGTGLSVGNHQTPLDSTVSPVFGDLFHGTLCGPCHSPDEHAGAATTNILANQYPEWFGGDGPSISSDDGHSDTFIIESSFQGDMVDTVRGTPCAACHTPEGFVRIFAHSESLSQGTINSIVEETGDGNLANPDGLPGAAAFGQVTCTSCHSSHEPGNKVRSPFTKADICFECHNVRALEAADGSGISGSSTLEIPRHAQKEVFEGKKKTANDLLRGFEFAGYTYSDSSHAGTDNVANGCTGCHYTVVSDEDLGQLPDKATTGHSFKARLETCLSDFGSCHQNADFLLADKSSFAYSTTTIGTFDFSSILYSSTTYPLLYSSNDYDSDGTVETFQNEITGMLDTLKNKVVAAGGDYDASQGLFDLTLMASDSDTIRAAAYNYDYIVGDRSLGLHNPLYVVNLLAVSITVLP